MNVHGEYKVPGGKLVVADLELSATAITAASISGDFFLAPDSALARINNALVGLPRSASEAAITAAVRAATPTAEYLGFSPEAVAITVRRAIDAAA